MAGAIMVTRMAMATMVARMAVATVDGSFRKWPTDFQLIDAAVTRSTKRIETSLTCSSGRPTSWAPVSLFSSPSVRPWPSCAAARAQSVRQV